MSASPPTDGQPVDDLDQQLVAYLDGELEDNLRAALEDRLMDDPECKRRMRALQQSFDMLDELPRTNVDDNFARTTVQLVAVGASQEMQTIQQGRTFRRCTSILGLLAASIVMFVGGSAVVRHRHQRQVRTELVGISVAEHLRPYSQLKETSDLEFIARLAADPAWQQFISDGRDLQELPQRNTQNRLAAVRIENRTQRIAEMPADLQRELHRRYEQYQSQTPGQQQQLRSTAATIESRADADQLTDSLVAYVDWLDTLPPAKQSEIQRAPVEKRLAMVRAEIAKDRAGVRDGLTGEDLKSIYQALFDIALTRVRSLPSALTPEEYAKLQRRANQMFGGREMEIEEGLAHWLVKGFVIPQLRGGRPGPQWNPFPWASKLDKITPAERASVADSLNPKARQILRAMNDRDGRDGHLLMWAMLAAYKSSPVDSAADDPLNAYESADPNLRERLDLSDPDEVLRALRSRQFRGNGRGFDPRRGGPNFRPPPQDHDGLRKMKRPDRPIGSDASLENGGRGFPRRRIQPQGDVRPPRP